jgi:hypothetical protein
MRRLATITATATQQVTTAAASQTIAEVALSTMAATRPRPSKNPKTAGSSAAKTS